LKAMLRAIEVFEQAPAEFAPFSSKYDAVLRKEAQLTASEARGLRIFEDPKQGNCASCHPSHVKGGAFPIFTDFGFVAIGVPRNRAVAVNQNAAYYDLGLCGPIRTDLSTRMDYCGRFRTPSLRNVAVRTSFFHNGVVSTLRDAVMLYAKGNRRELDDLPADYRRNVNVESPFDRPFPLSETDVTDLVAFLGTLTDATSR
jgi:cytochrome c peroxidase